MEQNCERNEQYIISDFYLLPIPCKTFIEPRLL